MNEIDLVINRPYIDTLSSELNQLAKEQWDNPSALAEILLELLFRKRKFAIDLRSRILERLVELSRQSFLWPSTEADTGDGSIVNVDWEKKGLLSYLGYRTGQKGIDRELRRDILDDVYMKDVPNVNSAHYMDKWGNPHTAKRLSRLAYTLATFVKNAKRKNTASMNTAIFQWEDDLNYLKAKYYIGKYDLSDFKWPQTDV